MMPALSWQTRYQLLTSTCDDRHEQPIRTVRNCFVCASKDRSPAAAWGSHVMTMEWPLAGVCGSGMSTPPMVHGLKMHMTHTHMTHTHMTQQCYVLQPTVCH